MDITKAVLLQLRVIKLNSQYNLNAAKHLPYSPLSALHFLKRRNAYLRSKRNSGTLFLCGTQKNVRSDRQNFHGTITNADQIDQHFNSFAASHHIATKRPECFLFIVARFNIPVKRIKQQWNVFHTVTSSLVQWIFFLPGTENLQIFWKNSAEE